jgi:hypothetical protein
MQILPINGQIPIYDGLFRQPGLAYFRSLQLEVKALGQPEWSLKAS